MVGPGRVDANARHDAAPEVCLNQLRQHEGMVLIDVDETLYLRNSTEDFIDCARPAVLALVAMRLLDLLKPWSFTGGDDTRDVWRVQAISILFPWTHLVWRAHVAVLARQFTNQPLLAALRCATNPPVIATVGFRTIVTPLVAAIGLPEARIIGARLTGFSDRRLGKLRLVSDALGTDALQRAVVVTDSLTDLPLLDACARPLRTVWPDSTFRAALRRAYLPGQYVTHVKHAGGRYITRGILQEDFVLWLLCSIGLAAHPLLHAAGMLFLLLSFWAIYEQGYVENDLVAARYEHDGIASRQAGDSQVATPRVQPWIWAGGAAAVSLLCLRWPERPPVWDFAKWGGVLLATRLWFGIYNRLDKKTRVWMYLGLQLARSAAFIVVAPTTQIGPAAIAANVFARWVPYFAYRRASQRWVNDSTMSARVYFFIILSGLFAAAEGIGLIWNWTTLALLGWCVLRARDELKAAVVGAARIDRGGGCSAGAETAEPKAALLHAPVRVDTGGAPLGREGAELTGFEANGNAGPGSQQSTVRRAR